MNNAPGMIARPVGQQSSPNQQISKLFEYYIWQRLRILKGYKGKNWRGNFTLSGGKSDFWEFNKRIEGIFFIDSALKSPGLETPSILRDLSNRNTSSCYARFIEQYVMFFFTFLLSCVELCEPSDGTACVKYLMLITRQVVTLTGLESPAQTHSQ